MHLKSTGFRPVHKLCKTTASFVMSVFPSVHIKQLALTERIFMKI